MRIHTCLDTQTAPLVFSPFSKANGSFIHGQNPIIKITGPLRAPYLFRIFTPTDHAHRISPANENSLAPNSPNLCTRTPRVSSGGLSWFVTGLWRRRLGGGKQIVSASSQIRTAPQKKNGDGVKNIAAHLNAFHSLVYILCVVWCEMLNRALHSSHTAFSWQSHPK